MWRSILNDNGTFVNFGSEHLICFTLTVSGIVGAIWYAKKYLKAGQDQRFITIICIFGAFTQLFKLFYRWHIGTVNFSEDLPLHLCNLLALSMPFIMWYKWRDAWAITFFWIVAACAQSLFTPALTESMPNYEAIRYWAVHGIIVLSSFYGLYVYQFTLDYKDAIRSFLAINVVAMILYPINLAIGANYLYLNAKPPGKTFYDLLGPWPGYIIKLEIGLIIVFSAMLIPFYLTRNKNMQ